MSPKLGTRNPEPTEVPNGTNWQPVEFGARDNGALRMCVARQPGVPNGTHRQLIRRARLITVPYESVLLVADRFQNPEPRTHRNLDKLIYSILV